MEEQGVVRLSSIHKPQHPLNDILPRWLELGVSLIISQDDHVALPEASALDQVLDVIDIIDTSTKLAALAKVVDANEKSFLVPTTVAQ